jgi:hypothetical protein
LQWGWVISGPHETRRWASLQQAEPSDSERRRCQSREAQRGTAGVVQSSSASFRAGDAGVRDTATPPATGNTGQGPDAVAPFCGDPNGEGNPKFSGFDAAQLMKWRWDWMLLQEDLVLANGARADEGETGTHNRRSTWMAHCFKRVPFTADINEWNPDYSVRTAVQDVPNPNPNGGE